MSQNQLTRREFLVSAGAAIAAAVACNLTPSESQPTATTTPPAIFIPPFERTSTPTAASRSSWQRVLRIGHITDIHMKATSDARVGMARALQSVQSQADPPDFLLNTGDSIMDGLKTKKEFAVQNWDLFASILQENCSLPIYHAIGNHDVWGWGLGDPSIQGDPLYGKGMALQYLGLEKGYYSFDRGGWRFIVLDSTHTAEIQSVIPYTGKLDEEQFAWLENDLAQTPASTPVCIATHIPILSACEYFDGPNETTGNWVVPGAWMHIDARRFRELFLRYNNVRLCLSGHAHQLDAVGYLDVQYFCDGAVCGNWWNGSYMDFPPLYAMINLYEDGSSEREVIVY